MTTRQGVSVTDLRTRGPVFDVSHKDFGVTPGASAAAVRAGISAALQAIAAAGRGALFIPMGAYDLGSLDAGGADAFLFEIATSDVSIVSPGALLTCNTLNSIPTIFRFTDCERIYCEGLLLDDTGANLATDWKGANFITWRSNSTGSTPFQTFHVSRCAVEHAVTFFTATGLTNGRRLERILLDHCRARRSYYGIVCQDQGDDLVATNFKFIDGRRAYFVYGVERHRVDLACFQDVPPASVDARILIKNYGRNTKNIKVRAAFSGSLQNLSYCVKLEHQSDVAGALIDDIDIEYAIDASIASAGSAQLLGLFSYSAAGVQETTTTNKRWDRIRVHGNPGPAAYAVGTKPIDITVRQLTEGSIFIGEDFRPAALAAPHLPGFRQLRAPPRPGALSPEPRL